MARVPGYMLSKMGAGTLIGDYFVNASTVTKLKDCNFSKYVTETDKALVLFYDPRLPCCMFSQKQFLQASKKRKPPNRGFGVVNCQTDPQICRVESVYGLPYFKLYSKGSSVTIDADSSVFSSMEMSKYIED